MRTSNYRKKLDKKTWRKIIAGAALIVLSGVIFFFVYFNVDHVEIQESNHYSKEEIKEMVLRGPLASNSVLAPMLYSQKVDDKPFVEGFEVSQVNRNTILVSVKEKQPVGCIKYLDCYIYFDRSGKVIESSVERDRKVPYFDGLEVASVVTGEELPMKETVLNTAVSLVRIFEKNDMIPDHILFDAQYEITLEYGDIAVHMGKDKYLEDKMARLIAILPSLEGRKGILHMESVTNDVKNITLEVEEEEEDTKEETEGQGTQDGTQGQGTDQSAAQGWDQNQDGTQSWDQSQDGTQGWGQSQDGTQGWGQTQDGTQSWDQSQDGTQGWGQAQDGTQSWGQTQDGTQSWDQSQYGTQNWGQTQDWTGGQDQTWGYGTQDNGSGAYGQQNWTGDSGANGQWGY